MSTAQTLPMRARKIGIFRQLKDDVNCIFERDPAARNVIEVMTTYPGLHAIVFHRIANRLWRHGFRYMARVLAFINRVWTNIDIHPGATIGQRFFIDHGAGVVIGETAEIGDDVTLYHGVTLGGTSWNKGKRHPTLGNGVIVGAGAKVLGPVVLGDKVRVGSNSVVVKDVPAQRTVVGIPGKIVQIREAGKLNPYGIDLDHHLIPDPVGRAIGCLMDRITELENRLANVGDNTDYPAHDTNCIACDAEQVCETEAKHLEEKTKSSRLKITVGG